MEEQENQIESLNSNIQIHRNHVRNNRIIVERSNLEIDSELYKFSELENDSKRNTSTVDCIFRIAFNDEGRFNELKEGIMRSLSTYFSTTKMDVEFLEDPDFLHISVIKKIRTDDIPLFMISIDASPKITSQTESIPSYRRSIKDVLDFGKLSEASEHCERPKTNLCFNCAGSHALKDCPEPRNQQKINKARKQFMTKIERYHIDADQRLAHLKPGKLSNSLKNALGLKSKELPSFFYRMRILGYPPGWLEDSKVANSGISLIDSEENPIFISDNDEKNSEPGEYKYDSTKIISFPGFNVDPGPGYYDDYKYHNVPAMDIQQKKDIFIGTLCGNLVTQGYKRKKINIPITSKPDTDKRCDFINEKEIESKIVRLNNQNEFAIKSLNADPIEHSLNVRSIKNPNHEELITTIRTTETNSRSSPSLADLEAQQIKLLEALQKSSSSIVSEDFIIDESNLKTNDDESVGEYSTVSINSSTICEEENKTLDTTINVLPSNKKDSVLGTPVLKFSTFDQLPKGENFKQGVSDVINFENLPDSTGKYEEMKIVLNKIRMKISKLNDQEN